MAEFRAIDVEESAMSDNRIFSDDEVENKFMDDISWVNPDHWLHSEMPWNTIHGKEWERDIELGRGSYGAVSVGHRVTDGKYFAIKSIVVEYPMSIYVRSRIETQINEIYMMRFLRSKYVPRCLGCGRSNGKNGIRGGESLDVFMEYVPRGSLKSISSEKNGVVWIEPPGGGKLDEDAYVRHYTHDLLKALQYVHSKRVVHGDIKMANILLSDTSVMLADWGGAKQLSSDLSNLKKFLIGTTGFQSPEVLNFYQQSYPSDIFSLGCTVIEMLTGQSPESIQARVTGLNQFFINKHADIPHVVIPDTMSALCKDFLKLCLCQKLEDRWTAQELLHHPFITNRDKACEFAYALTLDPGFRASILKPPRCRMDPELDDGRPTWRVSAHLGRLYGGNQPWKLYHLPWGCASTNPSQVQVPARRILANANYAKPLPIRVPDFYEGPENFVTNTRINSSSRTVTQRIPYYVEPLTVGRIEVCKPEDSKPKHRANDMTSGAARILPESAELQQFYETMIAHLEVFTETNNDIFKEAKEEAEKKDAEFAACSEDLFPELKMLKRSESGPIFSSLKLLRRFTGMSCQGGEDVEVVELSSSSSPRLPGKDVEVVDLSSSPRLPGKDVEVVDLSSSPRLPAKGKRKVRG